MIVIYIVWAFAFGFSLFFNIRLVILLNLTKKTAKLYEIGGNNYKNGFERYRDIIVPCLEESNEILRKTISVLQKTVTLQKAMLIGKVPELKDQDNTVN